jgi:hypothetical protein
VIHLALSDAVAAQHGGDRVDDAGARGQQRVIGPGELGADGGRVAARVHADVGPDRGQHRGQRVAARPALHGVADHLAELGQGQGGQAVLHVGQPADVLVQGRRAHAEPVGEQAHGDALEPDLVGQPGRRGNHVVTGQPGPRHGRAP